MPCFLSEIFCLKIHYHIAAQRVSIMWLCTIKGEAWLASNQAGENMPSNYLNIVNS
jgi:hypothetical protein